VLPKFCASDVCKMTSSPARRPWSSIVLLHNALFGRRQFRTRRQLQTVIDRSSTVKAHSCWTRMVFVLFPTRNPPVHSFGSGRLSSEHGVGLCTTADYLLLFRQITFYFFRQITFYLSTQNCAGLCSTADLGCVSSRVDDKCCRRH